MISYLQDTMQSMALHLNPSEEDTDLVHTWLLKVYYTSLAIVWFYSLSRWKNLLVATWLYSNGTAKADEERKIGSDKDCDELFPAVTVQILSYNEGEVLPATIARVCALDWPRDKIIVHVLDDSTDTSQTKVLEACEWQRRYREVNIEHKTRPDRRGFKAGNLAHHFDSITTEFVLYLDGDHQVQPDLLRRTIPLFRDPTVGLVQSPWGYYNTHANLLTECDALGLDIHHCVEQPARAYLHEAFGFNGTGGLWRVQAIQDAGGWLPDTVTEDLSISYLAHIQGYKFRYVADCPQQLELPQGILAHIQQKQRWTKGFLQVFRLHYWEILCSSTASWHVKLEAFWHFTGPLQLMLATLCILVYPHLVFHGIHTRWLEAMSIFPMMEPLCSAFYAIFTKAPSTSSDYAADHTRISRLSIVLPYFALRFGMAPFEFKAVCEGLISNDATFNSTPKNGCCGVTANSGSTTCSQNQVSPPIAQKEPLDSKIKRHWSDDVAAYGALWIALHQLVYVMMVLSQKTPDQSVFFYEGVRVLNVLICAGLVTVATSFLLSKHLNLQPKIDHTVCNIMPSRRKFIPAMLTLCLLNGTYMCVEHTRMLGSTFGQDIRTLPDFDAVVNQTSTTVNLKNATTSSFLCLPPQQALTASPPLHMAPLVVFAEPRTGSNLLFDMLSKRNDLARDSVHHPYDVEVLSLYELFADYTHEDWRHVEFVLKKLSQTCSLVDPTVRQNEATSQDISLVFESMRSLLDNKRSDPKGLLDALEKIPSFATNRAYFAFKVFQSHFQTDTFGGDITKLIRMIGNTPSNHKLGNPPKFIVIWRRRMIESFVSYQRAMTTKQWTSNMDLVATAPNTIKIEKAEIDKYIDGQRAYYTSVRQTLAMEGITDYLVLEYGRDLLEESSQLATIQALEQTILEVNGPSLAEDTMARLKLKKQQEHDLATMVENWDDVLRWGYGGDLDDWEDLFA